MTRRRHVHVLVCGERERGDDASALLAAEGLAGLPAWATVRVVGQLEPDDLLDLPDGDACLVVDSLSGVPPGTISRGSLASLLEGAAAPAEPESAALRSSHSLAPVDVLRLVQALRGGLPEGGYVGVRGQAFHLGAGLSDPVAAALPRLREAIRREIERLGRGREAAGG